MGLLGLLSAASLLGCGERGQLAASNDGGADAAAGPCDVTFARGSAAGHPRPLGAGATEARAGRLRAEDLPADPAGLLTWAAGDLVLANERVALVIEDAGTSDLLDPWGGKPVGLARVTDGRLVEPADFQEIIVTLGRFVVATEEVTVLSDGTDGGPAVVRAIGPLRPLPLLVDIGNLLQGEYGALRVAVDYSLSPGAEHAEITYRFASPGGADLMVDPPLLLFLQRNRMDMFAPDLGFAVRSGAATPYLGFVDERTTSYAWQDPDGPLSIFIEVANLLFISAPPFAIVGCGETVERMSHLHIGGPGLEGLRAAIARGDRRIEGVVRESDGRPAAGVRIHAAAGSRYLSRADTDAEGRYAFRVSEAEVTLTAFRRESAPASATWRGGPGPTLTLDPVAKLRVSIRDADTGEPMPALVQLVPVSGAAPGVPDSNGVRPLPARRIQIEHVVGGAVELGAPAGRYDLVVSRGYEYEVFERELDLGAGTSEVTASLRRSVATPGVMCADFHIHTNRSMDASDPVPLKVRAAAAEGLEIPVRSEHEWVGDFEPAIRELALERFLYGISSLELTTFSYGHFGVFPLDADPTQPNAGAVAWSGRKPPAVFDDARSRVGPAGPATVIINHPRIGGAIGGYFAAAEYDPVTGRAGQPDWWDERFSLVEVFNDSDFDANLATSVRDWFSLLDHGRRVFAVGSSDTHQVVDLPIGYPRTCIELDTDLPEELRRLGAGFVRDRLLEGRATVSGGIYVDARSDAGGPGSTLASASARETVRVTVQAATWIDATRLRVYANGALVQTLPLGPADPGNPALRYSGTVAIDVPLGGAWVVLVASGDRPLAPVHPGRKPFGVTNPLFFRR